MSCWGASPRGIGGSWRSRGAWGCERWGVDDVGEMGEWSHAGLRKGGSCCALAGRGRCRGQDQNRSVAGTKAGQWHVRTPVGVMIMTEDQGVSFFKRVCLDSR